MIDIESKEHLLNAVLEYCEDIVTVKDLSLRYVAYNKAFLKGVNATLDTPILGKTLADVLPFDCVNVIETSAQKAIKTKALPNKRVFSKTLILPLRKIQ